MNTFTMNGIVWKVKRTYGNDPILVDRTGRYTVAVTDPSTRTIYLSYDLRGKFKETVLIHELGHALMYSYNLLEELHSMVYPMFWVEAEEFICNTIANYGRMIFEIADRIEAVPIELERLVG